jgi:hypothetical protein
MAVGHGSTSGWVAMRAAPVAESGVGVGWLAAVRTERKRQSGRVVDGGQVLGHGIGRVLRHPSRHKVAVSVLWRECDDPTIAYEIHPLDLQVPCRIRSHPVQLPVQRCNAICPPVLQILRQVSFTGPRYE